MLMPTSTMWMDIKNLVFQYIAHVFAVFSKFGAHMHAGSAQGTGYLLRLVKAFVDNKQANQFFFVFHIIRQ